MNSRASYDPVCVSIFKIIQGLDFSQCKGSTSAPCHSDSQNHLRQVLLPSQPIKLSFNTNTIQDICYEKVKLQKVQYISIKIYNSDRAQRLRGVPSPTLDSRSTVQRWGFAGPQQRPPGCCSSDSPSAEIGTASPLLADTAAQSLQGNTDKHTHTHKLVRLPGKTDRPIRLCGDTGWTVYKVSLRP